MILFLLDCGCSRSIYPNLKPRKKDKVSAKYSRRRKSKLKTISISLCHEIVTTAQFFWSRLNLASLLAPSLGVQYICSTQTKEMFLGDLYSKLKIFSCLLSVERLKTTKSVFANTDNDFGKLQEKHHLHYNLNLHDDIVKSYGFTLLGLG